MISITLMIAIAATFWTQSRLPALDEKSQMGERVTMSAIAFDVVLPVTVNQAFPERVMRSSVNWGYTNWKGMTFGVLFAAAFFTLLQLIPKRSPSKYYVVNALKGLIIGIPLGVCANCSTPIAHSMVKAGTRIETALSTLISSPTLNIFVLTMTFSLLPLHLAIIKLLSVVFFILVIVPLLVKLLLGDKDGSQSFALDSIANKAQDDITPTGLGSGNTCEIPSQHWPEALGRTIHSYFNNLLYIAKTTVPLMFLAGILGAFVIEAVPFDSLRELTNIGLAIIAISIMGAFLPVPIAFDVIIVTTLLAAGLPISLSMSLLFALGTFSIYPAMVIARNISFKLSLALLVCVAIVAMVSGVAAAQYQRFLTDTATDQIQHAVSSRSDSKALSPSNSNESRFSAIATEQCGVLASQDLINQCIDNAVASLKHDITASETISTTTAPRPSFSEPCHRIKDRKQSKLCFSMEIRDLAINEGELEGCDRIGLKDIRANCQNAVILRKINALFAIDDLSRREDKTTSTVKSQVNTDIRLPLTTEKRQWLDLGQITTDNNTNLTISSLDLRPSQKSDSVGFTRVAASTLGIHLPFDFSFMDFLEPFKYGRGIASGDVNNDGLPDLAFASSTGIYLFVNTGNAQFEPIHLKPKANQYNSFLVAFADIDNNGWQDLFFTTYGGKNYIAWNNQGLLAQDNIQEIVNNDTNLTMAAGFIDRDHDGDLDVLLGNWSSGAENRFAVPYSKNLWMQTELASSNRHSPEGKFSFTPADTINGETLSILFSDFNHDSNIDLIIGNDSVAPDLYYLGDKAHNFKLITPKDGIIPVTSLTTMSVDSADFNNDLRLDLFTADMSFGDGKDTTYCELIEREEEKETCRRNIEGWSQIKTANVSWCTNISNPDAQRTCLDTITTTLAKQGKNPDLCRYISEANATRKHFCLRLAEKVKQQELIMTDYIHQFHKNRLLSNSVSGNFIDITQTAGVEESFWSWNAKAADLDNDGWQDLYVANGFGFGEKENKIHSNILFHNQGGVRFEPAQDKFGLTEYLNTPSYTYTDIDLDGDIDIVATAIMSQPRIYLNNATSSDSTNPDIPNNQSISFELRDNKGNTFCIGCKVTVSYGEKASKQQVRELKLSGGFLSFDNPVIYFGLEHHTSVDSIRIEWSDGVKTTISQQFESGQRYLITRQ